MWLPAKPLPTLVPLQALHLLCQEEFFNAKLRLYLCPSQNLSCTAHWISKKTQPPHLLPTCILHFSMRGGEGPLHLLFPLLEYSCLRSPPAQRRQPCHLSVGTVLYVECVCLCVLCLCVRSCASVAPTRAPEAFGDGPSPPTSCAPPSPAACVPFFSTSSCRLQATLLAGSLTWNALEPPFLLSNICSSFRTQCECLFLWGAS